MLNYQEEKDEENKEENEDNEQESLPAKKTSADNNEDRDEESEEIGKENKTLNKVNDFLIGFQRIPHSEKIFFVQHLAIMIKAGISLAKALRTLEAQTTNKRFKKAMHNVSDRVEKGQTLAESLSNYKNIFTELFINMIAAGEVSGKLEEILHQLYLQMKKEHELMSKIRGALIYPVVIFFAMIGIGAGMMVFVVPKLLDIFREVDVELPFLTRVLITVSDMIVEHGILVAIVLFIIIVVIWWMLKTYTGRYYWQWAILHFPIIGKIVKKINLARFARTMSSLLKTDIKIVESFDITSKTLSNLHYRESLEAAAEKIKKGEQINKVLNSYPNLYTHVILQMINVGEETGELDTILEELASFYEEEVAEIMNNLPSIIEPIIILILAVGIGAMAVAIITPMYKLTEAF